MAEAFDVAIIGAGVAGAMSAVKLSRRGLSVLMIDKAPLPREKVCGCCLNRRAIDALRAEGFIDLIASGTPLTSLELSASGRSTNISLPESISLSRGALDQALAFAAADAGCTVWDKAVGKLSPDCNHTVQVSRRGETIDVGAKVVLVADGLAGSTLAGHRAFARRVKPDAKRGYGTHLDSSVHDHRPGVISMRCGKQGYLGGVVLEDGRLDLAAAIHPDLVKARKNIAGAIEQIVKESGNPLPINADLSHAKWSATAPLHGQRPSRWSPQLPGVLVVGDSAGYVEPFTGEGMAWALGGSNAISPIVEQVVNQGWSEQAGLAWDRAYRRQVSRRQWRCRAVAAGLNRPRLTAATIKVLSAMPGRLRPKIDRILTPGGLGLTKKEAACGH